MSPRGGRDAREGRPGEDAGGRSADAARSMVPPPLRWILPLLSESEAEELASEMKEMHGVRRERDGDEPADRWLRRESRRAVVHLLARSVLTAGRRRRVPAAHGGRRGDRLARAGLVLRHAVRRVRHAPASTLMIVTTVALGIGGTTAAFSVVHGVLMEPLPYPDSDALVTLHTHWPNGREWNLSAADFMALDERQTSFESVAAYDPNLFTVRLGESTEQHRAFEVTPGFFPTLRLAPLLGRTFTPAEGEPGAQALVVLGHAWWRDRMGASGEVVGTTLVLNDEPHTVVGVLRERPGPLEHASPFFVNYRMAPPARKGPFSIRALARLRADTGIEAAQVEAHAINARIFPIWEDGWPDAESTWRVRRLKETIVGDAGASVLIALGAVGLLLLIACTNAASLLVARGLHQRPQIAVRAAIGASRGRLIRELMTESAIMACVGSLAGLGVALGGIELTRTVGADFIPRAHEIGLDGPVLGFLLLVTVGSLALFGILPAVQSSGGQLAREVASAGRGRVSNRRAARMRRFLVGAEFAVAAPLLVGSVLLLVSLGNLVGVDPGYDPDGLLTAHVTLPPSYDTREGARSFWDGLTAEIEALPGVARVGISDGRPPAEPGFGNNFVLEDRPLRAGEAQHEVPWLVASPEYFEALGVAVIEGRMFDQTRDGERVAIVDRTWAERFYPAESAVGRRFRHGGCTRPDCDAWEVIGVVDDVLYGGIAGEADGTMYLDMDRFSSRYAFLVARVTVEDPLTLLPAIRGLVREAEPAAPIARVATGRELVRTSLQEPRYLSFLIGGFAAVALLLSLVGVYGVMAYFVQEHRKGIGVRLALGGAPRSIVGFVLRNGLGVVLAGTAVGVGVGLATTRVLDAFLFGIDPASPLAFVTVVAGLLALAGAACYWPALRAARIDPASLLRED